MHTLSSWNILSNLNIQVDYHHHILIGAVTDFKYDHTLSNNKHIKLWQKMLHLSTRHFVWTVETEGYYICHDHRSLGIKVKICSWRQTVTQVTVGSYASKFLQIVRTGRREFNYLLYKQRRLQFLSSFVKLATIV